ncbi:serpin B3-like [Leptopilina heterotoma]|uniref:serpin B3-like n=1 Tax=Leptopilina heterotoma TaxID=63436 RepID=UPI001CA87AC2|nr:serpin B3-like [Leptopilina heterotoma]
MYHKQQQQSTHGNQKEQMAKSTTDGRCSSVPGMKQSNTAYHGNISEINASFVELLYKGDNLKMIIVLPNNGVSLEEVERGLEGYKFQKVRSLVHIKMPKFRIEASIDLVDILKEMGVQEVFTIRANLTGISGKVQLLRNDDEMDVDEYFTADRPIHFKIIKTVGDHDGIVLFSGNYKGKE